ncbi:hypothetical protein [Streptomyces sp. NPDC058985]|uniref:hypothetical protein n=1 Tax=Streptomyces sp. NPDC058985 TaxID=3346684 RepID=UPI0036852A03
MTDPSKVAPTCRACNHNRTGHHRLPHAVQITGRMLCWNLAAADVLTAPQAG